MCTISFAVNFTSTSPITAAKAIYKNTTTSQTFPDYIIPTPITSGSLIMLPDIEAVGTYELIIELKNRDGATVVSGVENFRVGNCQGATLPPTAYAGGPQSIRAPKSYTTLNGSGIAAIGSNIIKYLWTSPENLTLTDETTPTVTVWGLTPGTHSLDFKVTDDHNLSATDTVSITVLPAFQPPFVDAGGPLSIRAPKDYITLFGSSSVGIGGNILTNLWTSQENLLIEDATTLTPTVSQLTVGTHSIDLTVTDDNGLSATDTVSVTVLPAYQAPIAYAGGNPSIRLPKNYIELAGSGTAVEIGASILTHQWTSPENLLLTGDGTPTVTVWSLTAGTHAVNLKVTDSNGLSDIDTATITVLPAFRPPVAHAGGNQSVRLPKNFIELIGSGTPVEAGATISTHQWTSQDNLPLTGATTPTVTVSSLTAGTHTMSLKVTDSNGLSGTETATITVLPAFQPPVANAGGSKVIEAPANSLQLTGTGTAVESGSTIVSYLWTSSQNLPLTGATTPKVTVSSLTEGVHPITLKVTDSNGLTATDTVTITVNPQPRPPVPNAGPDKTIYLPTNSVNLSGSVTAGSGAVKSYLWTSPEGFPLTGAATLSATVSSLTLGSHTINFTATDDHNLSATDSMTITVLPKQQPPVANAGADQSFEAPRDDTKLYGSGTPSNGSTIVSYQWTSEEGFQMTAADTANPGVVGLTVGSHIFTLTVTDNHGLQGTDTVTITVTPHQEEVIKAVVTDIEVIPQAPTTQDDVTIVANTYNPDGVGGLLYDWYLNDEYLGQSDTNEWDLGQLIEGSKEVVVGLVSADGDNYIPTQATYKFNVVRGGVKGSSFLPGTMISMAEGEPKRIQDIKIGDFVKSSKNSISKVVAINNYITTDKIFFLNETKPFITATHPIMAEGGWKSFDPEKSKEQNPLLEIVGLLKEDDKLIMENEQKIPLSNTDFTDGSNQVYNITVDNTKDYFANGYWVHNKIELPVDGDTKPGDK